MLLARTVFHLNVPSLGFVLLARLSISGRRGNWVRVSDSDRVNDTLRERLKQCQGIWSLIVKQCEGGRVIEVRERYVQFNEEWGMSCSDTQRCCREVRGAVFDSVAIFTHSLSALWQSALVFRSPGSLWNSCCLLSPLQLYLLMWLASMAEYGVLRVPVRSYSRFSCTNYKLVRNQRVKVFFWGHGLLGCRALIFAQACWWRRILHCILRPDSIREVSTQWQRGIQQNWNDRRCDGGAGSYERKRLKRKGQLEIETSGAEPALQEPPGIILEAPWQRREQMKEWTRAFCWDLSLPRKPLDVLNMVSGRGLHLNWLCAWRSKVDFLWKGRRKHCYQSMSFVDSALGSVPLPEL